MKFQKPSTTVRVCSIVLSVLLVLTLLVSGTLSILRSILNAEAIRNSVSRVNVTDIRIPVKDSASSSDGSDSTDTVSLSEYLVDQLGPRAAQQYNLTPERMDSLLTQSAANEFLADVIARYTSALVDGAPLEALTAAEVVEFVRNNAELIHSELGYTMTEADYEKLYTVVRKNLDEYLDILGLDDLADAAEVQPNHLNRVSSGSIDTLPLNTFPTPSADNIFTAPYTTPVSTADVSSPDVPDIIRATLSDATMWILTGVCALLLGLIVVLNLHSALSGLRMIAIALLSAAGLFALISAAILLLPLLLNQPQISVLLSPARGCALLYFAIYLLIGGGALACLLLLRRKAEKETLS